MLEAIWTRLKKRETISSDDQLMMEKSDLMFMLVDLYGDVIDSTCPCYPFETARAVTGTILELNDSLQEEEGDEAEDTERRIDFERK